MGIFSNRRKENLFILMKRILVFLLVMIILISGIAVNAYSDDAIAEKRYNSGMDCFEKQDYEQAFSYFLIAGEVNGYAAAQNMLGICYRDGLGTQKDSAEAERYFKLASDQGYQKAADNLAKMSEEKEAVYQKAIELFLRGDLGEAKVLFQSLEGYERSADFISMCEKMTEETDEVSAETYYKVGDVIEFGSYEQDNDITNGKEKIEWIILDIRNGEMFLISKYALDSQKYNEGFAEITWEDCTLRAWLNDFFFEEAFSSDEQGKILSIDTGFVNENSSASEHASGSLDKVSLLSLSEIKKYFPPGSKRQCNPTAYAKERGCYANADSGACSWWLRAPGSSEIALLVYETDSLNIYGDPVDTDYRAVRPIIWISAK